jgi:hypothetical protein
MIMDAQTMGVGAVGGLRRVQATPHESPKTCTRKRENCETRGKASVNYFHVEKRQASVKPCTLTVPPKKNFAQAKTRSLGQAMHPHRRAM